MDKLLQIDLSDVKTVMDLYLNRIHYPHLDKNTNKQVVEIGLKNYIINKINEANSLLRVNDTIELYQLVEDLSILSGINNDRNISYLIEYLLFIMSNEQQYPIKWTKVENDNYVAQPNIIRPYDVITNIETSEFPNSASIFNYLFNYYINQFNENRTR